MIHKHPGKIVFCLMLLTALALLAVTGSRVDFTAGTTPGNPGAGKFRLWANSGSGQLECLNSSGGSCMPSGGGSPGGASNDIQYNDGAGGFGGGRCTMDSSSNVSCAGSMTTGSGGGTTGSVALRGATSGTVTIQPQAVAGTYNFNLPTSAGSPGQPLLSGGGGASAQTYGALALSNLATQNADTVVMNASGSSAAPTAVAMPTSGTNGCAGASNALTYNTSTHALGCNSISGSGLSVSGNYLTDGSNYYIAGPNGVVQATRANCASYTWRNQGGATCTDNADGSITVVAPAGASAALRILEVTPSATFTATANIVCDLQPVQFLFGGMVMVESGTGKAVTWGIQTDTTASGTYTINRANWTNVTTFSSQVQNVTNGIQSFRWFRVQQDASNLLYYVSDDGTLWKLWRSESKTTFFTSAANRVGIVLNAQNASVSATCTVRSFTVV